MVEGGLKCAKYLLFIFNLLFFISGLLLIIIGALVLTSFHQLFNSFGGIGVPVAVFLIIVGAVIFIIAFFGCCGACRESYCMIVTFAAFLCIVLILEFAAAIAAFAMRSQLRTLVENELSSKIEYYYVDEPTTLTWDNIQGEFSCCGAVNYTDWRSNSHLNMSVPTSCCVKWAQMPCNVTGLPFSPPDFAANVIYTDGCVDTVSHWAISKVFIIGGAAAGLTFVQVLGIILAICLARGLKEKYEFA